jgi:hypothetical protein
MTTKVESVLLKVKRKASYCEFSDGKGEWIDIRPDIATALADCAAVLANILPDCPAIKSLESCADE